MKSRHIVHGKGAAARAGGGGTFSTCDRCRAQIRWVYTRNGKRMPLDPVPRDDGPYVVLDEVAHKRPAKGDERSYVCHFDTCVGHHGPVGEPLPEGVVGTFPGGDKPARFRRQRRKR